MDSGIRTAGITKLSELEIDVHKDWAAKKIENLGPPDTDDDAPRRDTIDSKIAAKLKVGSVTDTTSAAGLISVTFAEAFASTPIVTVQLENDVDYYCVVTAKSTTGFTAKILKTAHIHSQGNTGAEASHTHGISFASGAGGSHRHSNPNTGYPSTTSAIFRVMTIALCGVAGAPSPGYAMQTFDNTWMPTHTHAHTQGNTGYESSHTHVVSGTSGAGGSHSHSNPNTNSTNAGNTLASTGVTFSYIAILP